MGQKYAAYDAQGAITAFYDSVDSPPPGAAQTVEISDDEWAACINEHGRWYVANGALAQLPPPSDEEVLAQARAAQIDALSRACANAVASGFSCSALGATCDYPSTAQDQANQQAVAASPDGGMLWCRRNGAWSLAVHSQQQAGAVVAGFVAWLNACQQQLVKLSGDVNASAIDAVASVVWTNPKLP